MCLGWLRSSLICLLPLPRSRTIQYLPIPAEQLRGYPVYLSHWTLSSTGDIDLETKRHNKEKKTPVSLLTGKTPNSYLQTGLSINTILLTGYLCGMMIFIRSHTASITFLVQGLSTYLQVHAKKLSYLASIKL